MSTEYSQANRCDYGPPDNIYAGYQVFAPNSMEGKYFDSSYIFQEIFQHPDFISRIHQLDKPVTPGYNSAILDHGINTLTRFIQSEESVRLGYELIVKNLIIREGLGHREAGFHSITTALHASSMLLLAQSELGENLDENTKVLSESEMFSRALSHDIGKYEINDEDLMKNGKPSDREQRRREHIKNGAIILDQNGLSSEHQLAAMRHHVNGDINKSYPLDVNVTDKSDWEHLLTIADVFDSLLDYRHYRNDPDKTQFTPQQAHFLMLENFENGTFSQKFRGVYETHIKNLNEEFKLGINLNQMVET